jgi:hypothetical protein
VAAADRGIWPLGMSFGRRGRASAEIWREDPGKVHTVGGVAAACPTGAWLA